MIELLNWSRQKGWDRLKQAIKQVLAPGCSDTAAVCHLLNIGELARAKCEGCELHPGLRRYETSVGESRLGRASTELRLMTKLTKKPTFETTFGWYEMDKILGDGGAEEFTAYRPRQHGGRFKDLGRGTRLLRQEASLQE